MKNINPEDKRARVLTAIDESGVKTVVYVSTVDGNDRSATIEHRKGELGWSLYVDDTLFCSEMKRAAAVAAAASWVADGY